MKIASKIIAFAMVLMFTNCVQKTKKQAVTLLLDVKGQKNISKVGVRGNNKPLSWDSDLEMKLGKDSLYTVTFTSETGYTFTEVKFTINEDFELKEQNNRRIDFHPSGQTTYKATFNEVK